VQSPQAAVSWVKKVGKGESCDFLTDDVNVWQNSDRQSWICDPDNYRCL